MHTDEPSQERPGLIFSRIYLALACLILLTLGVKAWIDVDWAWDSWHYHFPFAATLWHLVPDGSYIPDPDIQTRFLSFPLLGEWLQGALWAATGRIQGANFLAYSSLLAFLAFLHKTCKIPFYYAAIALLAVPFIQIHSTICFVDLPGNVALSILVLLVYRMLCHGNAPTLFTLLMMAFSAIFALNIKLAYLFIVVPAFLLSFPMIWRMFQGQTHKFRLLVTFSALFCVLLALAVPIRNAIQYGNPFYGTRVHIGGWVISEGYNYEADHPDKLGSANNMQRWLYSLAEIDHPPLSWTYDQHYPEAIGQNGAPGDFTGGYFNGLVLFDVLLFILLCWQAVRAGLPVRRTAAFMCALTLLVGFLPQSCLLRYYMVWIMVLIALDFDLLLRLIRHGSLPTRALSAVAVMQLLFFAVVLCATRAQYFWPQHRSLGSIRRQIDIQPFPRFQNNHAYCMVGVTPFALLYSEGFHPNPQRNHYVLNDRGWPPVMRVNKTWPPVFSPLVRDGLCLQAPAR